ncbi:hypothetical protein FQZ97_938290 [compost metagenome]
MTEWKAPLSHITWLAAGLQITEAKYLLQQWYQEPLYGQCSSVNVLTLACIVEGLPLSLGDTPVTTDLITQL